MYIPGVCIGLNGMEMSNQISQFSRLEKMLDCASIPSKQKTYHCTFIDETCIVFSETDGTKKVMIPVIVALEWINALESGLINRKMNAREMRKIIAPHSEWAPYQHGFETHLQAIVLAWNLQRLDD